MTPALMPDIYCSLTLNRFQEDRPMKNLGAMMKQAQQIQAKMAELQEEMAGMLVIGRSGAGMVEVTLNGKSEARRVKIDPSLFEDKDAEVLEEVIAAALHAPQA